MLVSIPSDEMERFEIRRLPSCLGWQVECDQYAVFLPFKVRPESQICQVFEYLKQFADQHGVQRLVLDIRQIQFQPSAMVKFQSMQSVSQLMPPPYRLAILQRPEMYDRFPEDVAVNRGANVYMSCEEPLAWAWLWDRDPDQGCQVV